MLKKGLGVLLTIVLIFSFAISAKASESITTAKSYSAIGVQPSWIDIAELKGAFKIYSGGKAEISVRFSTYDSAQLKIQAYLEQYSNGNWVIINNWEESAVGTTCTLTRTYYVISGYYRLISIGTVYKNGIQVEQAGTVSDVQYY